MATSREILALIVTGDSSSAVKALDQVGNKADKELGRATKAGDKWSAGLIKGGAVAVGVGAVGAGALFKLGNAASDLSETQNKVNVVFGQSAGAVLAFGKTSAQAVGLSENAAAGAAATYGNLFRSIGLTEEKSADMSVALVKLAGDLASFNNANPEDVLLALRSGLTGEVEPLRQFGVNLNDARLKAEALTLGLSDGKATLDASAKAQAAYSLILKDTSLAQGDFARTADGAANQQRIFKAQMEDLQAKIGAGVLPVMNALLQGATGVGDALGGAGDGGLKLIGTLGTLGVGLAAVGGVTSLAAGGVLKYRANLEGLAETSPRTAAALTGLGRSATIAVAAFAGFEILKTIGTLIEGSGTDFKNLGVEVERLGNSQVATGAIADTFGTNMEDLSRAIGLVADKSLYDNITGGFDRVGAALDIFPDETVNEKNERLRSGLDKVDKQLADLVTSGNAEAAAAAFKAIADSAEAQGVPLDKVEGAFNDYTSAVDDAAKASSGAKGAVSGLGDEQAQTASEAIAAAKAEKQAAAAAAETQLAATLATGSVISLAQAFQILGQSANIDAASTVGNLTTAAFAQFDAAVAVDSAWTAYNDTLVDTTSSSGGAGGAAENLTAKFYEQEQKLTAVRDATQEVGDAQVELGRAQRDARESFEDLTEAAKEYHDIIHGQAGTQNAKSAKRDAEAAKDAQIRANQEVRDAEHALNKARAGGNKREIREAELDLRAARRNAAEATENAAEAQRIYTGVVKGFPKDSQEAQSAQENLTGAYDSAYDSLTNVREATDSAKDSATALGRASDDLAGKLDNIKTGGSQAQVQSLTDKLNQQKTAAKNVATEVGAAVAQATGSVAKGIEATILTLKSIVDANPRLKGAFDSVLNNLQRELALHLLGASGQPKYPAGVNPSRFRAKGGPVTGGELYVVGEEGPEMFVPKQSGTIIPNSAIRRGGSAASGADTRPIYVVVNVDPVTGEQTVRTLQSYNRTKGPVPILVAG